MAYQGQEDWRRLDEQTPDVDARRLIEELQRALDGKRPPLAVPSAPRCIYPDTCAKGNSLEN